MSGTAELVSRNIDVVRLGNVVPNEGFDGSCCPVSSLHAKLTELNCLASYLQNT